MAETNQFSYHVHAVKISLRHSQGWKAPVIEESFDPERISLVLPLRAEEPAMKTGDKKPAIKK